MVLVWKDSRLAHSLLEHPECLTALTTRRPSNGPVLAAAAAGLRRGHWRAGLSFLSLGVACLGCFTDPINRAPVVTSINADVLPVMRGKPASFTATAYDPDSDSVTVSWAQRSGGCPDLSQAPTPAVTKERFPVEGTETTGPFCVWAFATDRYGAVGMKNHDFVPGNLPPVAMMALLSPKAASLYPLYTTFELSNESKDPEADSFTSEWDFDRPPGSMAQLLATGCSMAASHNDVHCFKADVPGQYTVTLTVTTEDNQSSTDTKTYTVNMDTLPCIAMPDPRIDGTPPLDPTQAQSFTVAMVIDDGDPYPPPPLTSDVAHFNWFFTVKDALVSVEHDYPTLPIPTNQYHEGDVAKIRVEVHDRNRKAVDDAFFRCGDAADLCAGDPLRPTCYQRVTWTVNWL